MPYSIIIPIHNEKNTLEQLIQSLKSYSHENEIIIINDGSTDSSKIILDKCSFINTINLKKNHGKGYAIRKGLERSTENKILITDGDLELDSIELKKLMILDKTKNVNLAFGSRKNITELKTIWNYGNYLLTYIFNLRNRSKLSDALCCAIAFYKSDISITSLQSNSFDIDVELKQHLIRKEYLISIIPLLYKRRNTINGKKLNIFDGWIILKRILS